MVKKYQSIGIKPRKIKNPHHTAGDSDDLEESLADELK
jgi:hypothetical protein